MVPNWDNSVHSGRKLLHGKRVSMLGELIASLSHEIKQPIAAIVMKAQTCLRWLKHELPDIEEARATAARIWKDRERAGEIMERIRSLNKKSPPKRELVEVNKIVGEMAELLRSEANRYDVAIRTDSAAAAPQVMVDRVQLDAGFHELDAQWH